MRQISLTLAVIAGVAMLRAADRLPMKWEHEHSAEAGWTARKVHAARPIASQGREGWTVEGNGDITFPTGSAVRVAVHLFGQKGQPNATARRAVANEDWREYNRLSFWLRTDAPGFPVLTLMVTVRNASVDDVPEVHRREATHNVTVPNGKWTLVQWEIPHVRRDRVTALEFRPWVNKILAHRWDAAAYEIRGIELQRVDADHHEGWNVAPDHIAFSHTGYLPEAKKVAIASGPATDFELVRGSDVVLRRKAVPMKSRLGEFRVLDFSEVTAPGTYTLRAGNIQSRPFRIGSNVWDRTVAKTINFFYGERCGIDIPGVHEACHRDWQAFVGNQSIIMNGGWHDAGDLSQGMVNTGEATHAMFSLADDLRDSELRHLVLDEAKWGLDWIHKVRFPGGFRIGFASLNMWTNGIIGDGDDRRREALNNPNVNYIAAAAGAAAYNILKDSDPELARKSLAIAEDDWRHAITGIESPATQSTPAFAATQMELAAVGVIASVELFKATGREEYARKARELGAIVVASQQRDYVGREFPLAGFFYTGPDRKSIFHQFHRATDQAPVVAMTMLCREFPQDPEWMTWYSAAAIHAEYQKRTASTTAPYEVLPAYLYRDDEWQTIADGDRYGSSRESFRKQVLEGMAIGGGYYLRAFPVWFTRRGNYGILLSQAKALSAASRLRNDQAGLKLAERQLQWVVGQNPFAQSTMWGEGYDFAPQYSVSVGDLTGELPVGMMTRGDRDVPYWPATNSYVFKEVWVHPSARWLGIVQDLTAAKPDAPINYSVRSTAGAGGAVTITVTARGTGTHTFTLRTANLKIASNEQKLTLKPGVPSTLTWQAEPISKTAPWVAVAIADGNASQARDVVGYAPLL